MLDRDRPSANRIGHRGWARSVAVGVVLANYVAQVPYALHLYGLRVNPVGTGLLVLTLGWFLIGWWLMARRIGAGYWITLAFLVTDFGFYLFNEIQGWVHGYGAVFHLTRFSDPILWAVFLVGYLNFIAAGYLLWMLAARRKELVGA